MRRKDAIFGAEVGAGNAVVGNVRDRFGECNPGKSGVARMMLLVRGAESGLGRFGIEHEMVAQLSSLYLDRVEAVNLLYFVDIRIKSTSSNVRITSKKCVLTISYFISSF